MRRVRAAALGLFFISAPGCGRPDPRSLGAAADSAGRTGLYTWLVEHDPSAIVAWRVPADRLRPLTPDARIIPAGAHPCAQAVHFHAVLVLVSATDSSAGKRDREAALDCGFALFRDAGGLVIAPR